MAQDQTVTKILLLIYKGWHLLMMKNQQMKDNHDSNSNCITPTLLMGQLGVHSFGALVLKNQLRIQNQTYLGSRTLSIYIYIYIELISILGLLVLFLQ